MTIYLRTALFTQQGIARGNNEDCVRIRNIATERYAMACLCDGIGGLEDGEIASRIVVDIMSKKVRSQPKKTLLERVKKAERQLSKRVKKCGTTISAIIIDKEKNEFYGISIGDSRIYTLTGNGIIAISKDDNMRDRYYSGHNILTNAIGIGNAFCEKDIILGVLNAGDSMLILSDGAYSKITNEDLYEICRTKKPEEQIIKIAEYAVLRNSQDDISIVICKACQV